MKSGRVIEVKRDGTPAVVRDADGTEYACSGSSAAAVDGDVVLFELEDVKVGTKSITKVAKVH
jgi:hypothetical protein